MSKAQFISLTTIILFSLLLLMYFSFYETNIRFNDLIINSVIGEELIFQSETAYQAFEDALNADYRIVYDNNINILMESVLSSGMNPSANLTMLNTFLPFYDSRITPSIAYSLTELSQELNTGFYGRIIKPTDNLIQFNYNDDKIRITNASKAVAYSFTINCSAPITAISWDSNPSGSDITVNYIHYNGTISAYNLSLASNNECNVTCGGNKLSINYNFIGQDRIEIFYSEFSMLNFGLKMSFDATYGNLFKISSPYFFTNVTLSYKDFAVTKGMS